MKQRPTCLIGCIALLTGLTALTVMAGWLLHIPLLVQIYPTSSPMQFNTALVILLLSFVLYTIERHASKLSLLVTVGTLIFLTATMIEYAFDINLGIDDFFIQPFITVNTSSIGRLAPNTALALLFIGLALLFLHKKQAILSDKYAIPLITLLSATAFSLGIIALIGYSNNLGAAYAWGNFTRMAVHSAVCIVLLSTGILINLTNKAINHLVMAPVAVLVGGFVIAVSLSLAIYGQENIFFEKNLQEKANHFASIASLQLQDFYRSLERMSDRLSYSKQRSNKPFQEDAKNYIRDFPFIDMLGWADNTTSIQWLVSLKDHKRFLLYTLKSNPRISKKIETLAQRNPSQKPNGVSIFLNGNDKQFFYIMPIFRDNIPHGFLIVQIDVPQFVKNLFPFFALEESFFVSIYTENNLLFSNIPLSMRQKNSKILHWKKNAIITNHDAAWLVTVNPSPSMLAKKNTNTPWMVFGIGLFLTALTAMAVFFRLKSQYNAIELLAAQHLNKAILNSATYLIVATDIQGTVVVFNHYAQKMLGYTEEEVVNKVTPALWHDANEIKTRAIELSKEIGRVIQPGFDVFITKALSSGSEAHEWTFIRKDGTTFPGLLIATALNSDTGNGIGFLGIIEDLTERKHAEQQLAEYTKELENSNQEMVLLNELSKNLQACATLEETYFPIVHYCQKVLKIPRGILYIIDKERDQFKGVLDWGYTKEHAPFYLKANDCKALEQKKIYSVPYSEKDLRCKHTDALADIPPSYLCIPIQSNFNPLGLLYIEIPKEEADFLAWSKSGLINLMAEQLNLSFTSIQLREHLHLLSVRDPLTGLYNRRYLEASIDQEIASAQRTHSSFVIALMDIDYFKDINDRFGHEAGDMVLQTLSQLFLNIIRKSDIASRWGGEEFLLYFKNTSIDTIYETAENLRKAIEKLQIPYNKEIIGITISIGLAQYPQHGLTLASLFTSADKALYKAKNTGRNKVIIAT